MKRSLNIHPFELLSALVILLFLGCGKGGSPAPQNQNQSVTAIVPLGVYTTLKKEKLQTDGTFQTQTMTSCESGSAYNFDKSGTFGVNSTACNLDVHGTWVGDKSNMTIVAYATDNSGNKTYYLNGTVSNIGSDSRGNALFTLTQNSFNGFRLTFSSISLY